MTPKGSLLFLAEPLYISLRLKVRETISPTSSKTTVPEEQVSNILFCHA